MHNIKNLRVYHLSRENLRDIITITTRMNGFGDLKNQIQRSALSVASNIAEGSGSNSDKQFVKFLGYAKASNKELETQIEILSDLNQLNKDHQIFDKIDHVSAMLSKLIARLNY